MQILKFMQLESGKYYQGFLIDEESLDPAIFEATVMITEHDTKKYVRIVSGGKIWLEEHELKPHVFIEIPMMESATVLRWAEAKGIIKDGEFV